MLNIFCITINSLKTKICWWFDCRKIIKQVAKKSYKSTPLIMCISADNTYICESEVLSFACCVWL